MIYLFRVFPILFSIASLLLLTLLTLFLPSIVTFIFLSISSLLLTLLTQFLALSSIVFLV